ncbi:helix-turn-helix domain-containing protein [Lactobacillus crispatus]|uniref:Helix-turn-helix transcriptional regulator n=1 Tax=Lactobacillus crispatus TaxID=47770 RepID=A0AAW6XIX2_9LACO|nr:helix-turn-helix transcriptional regulator [Lactobacillus crispatus]MDK6503150.1 helix-turn-helix transcriptional regulator [Lactobacillus crispatus]
MNKLRKLRQNKNLTLNQLSNQLSKNGFNITSDALAKYERGNREPKLETWQKLANFFGVSVGYLQGIEPNYLDISNNTKWTILDVLNSNYFDGLDVDNPRSNEQFSILSNKVNKLIEFMKLKKYPIDFYPSKMINDLEFELIETVENYWKNNFSFLFQDSRLIELANKHLEVEQKYYETQIAEKKFDEYCKKINFLEKQMSTSIIDDINKYLQENYASNVGKKAFKLIEKKLNAEYSDFVTNILTAKTSNDIEKVFFTYEDNLDSLSSDIKKKKIFDNIKDS